ncbi:hypothetical protein LR48_Vigan07g174800 [Vigna angularis]|uniref:Cytochrome P450 n=1 Tax=Phaseolus angularis TaxID=3914 RepID=A0A0L9UZU3_PHAAN|nr:hypothetical protein LR48_Vigan07g174800 [Vigna angularis]
MKKNGSKGENEVGKRLRSKLKKQHISGPPPTILLGNILELMEAHFAASKPPSPSSSKVPSSYDCAAPLLPLFEKWRNEYGQVFTFSLGTIQIMCVNQPDMVRDFTVCTSLDLGKSAYQLKNLEPLLGQGILSSNGAKWVHQRNILAPELYMDKVKGMMNIVSESAVSVVNSWSKRIE